VAVKKFRALGKYSLGIQVSLTRQKPSSVCYCVKFCSYAMAYFKIDFCWQSFWPPVWPCESGVMSLIVNQFQQAQELSKLNFIEIKLKSTQLW